MRVPSRPFAILVALALSGVAAAASPLTPNKSSKIWFDGSSSVRDFSCRAKSFSAAVGDKVEGAKVEIPVSALDCANGTMNGHMAKALDPSKPIRFEVGSYSAAGKKATIKGNLTIHGQTQPVTLSANITPGDTEVRVAGTHQLAMTDYGVKPPTLMMGTMKVRPTVTVHFDLGFPREAMQQLAPSVAAGP